MRLQLEMSMDIVSKIANLLKLYSKDDLLVSISPTVLKFFIDQSHPICVWIECKTNECFSKFQIKSKNNNTIAFRVSAHQLAQSLDFEDSSTIKIQLSQAGDFIFLQIVHNGLDALKNFEHRVPITLLAKQSTENLKEPQWPDDSMVSEFPSVKAVHDWCSVIQNAGIKVITVSILKEPDNTKVSFNAETESKLLKIETTYTIEESENDDELKDVYEIAVNVKQFLKIMKVMQLQPAKSTLYIHSNVLLRLVVDIYCAQITFSISGITE